MNDHVFDREKWQARPLAWQMGNIGSEVGRALKAKSLGNLVDMNAAFYRGLDLFDATAAKLTAEKSPRAREVRRAREQFAQAILGEHEDPALENYFMQFAIAARSDR